MVHINRWWYGLLLIPLTLQGCFDCSYDEPRQCYLDGVTEAKEECKKLQEQSLFQGRDAFAKGVQDGYKKGFEHRGHKYTWLLWLRDLIVEFIMVIAGVLLLGLLIGHFKADRSETFSGTTTHKAKLVRRRTMMGLEHIGILKGQEFHRRNQEQRQALVSELAD